MRPRQWTKNLFVYVPLFYDRKVTDPASILAVTGAFILLCLMSSAVYIMNDLADIESDREHPVKKNRPLPSGELDPRVATIAAVVLALFSLIAGYFIAPALALILLAYLILQIAYTFWLKHIVLLDVMTIAAGFILRIAAGVAVIRWSDSHPGCMSLVAFWPCLWLWASGDTSWFSWGVTPATTGQSWMTIQWS
ncbi:MAG: UbiA family prenyltransferase [Chloroflexota bacterium]